MLVLAGLDPGGGAGLQADIQTLTAAGVHAMPVVTALTVQDSRNVRRVEAVSPALLAEQLACLLADVQVAAVKIGLLGEAAQIPLIADWLQRLAVPVVCDTVLRAGGGTDLANAALLDALRARLLPCVTLATPNAAEARRLLALPPDAPADTLAAQLPAFGCANWLVTGGDEAGDAVSNHWYRADAAAQHYVWPRLPETFHGAGCTLASAIAARLALGHDLAAAIDEGQRWTQAALAGAYAVGGGRRVPNRLGIRS